MLPTYFKYSSATYFNHSHTIIHRLLTLVTVEGIVASFLDLYQHLAKPLQTCPICISIYMAKYQKVLHLLANWRQLPEYVDWISEDAYSMFVDLSLGRLISGELSILLLKYVSVWIKMYVNQKEKGFASFSFVKERMRKIGDYLLLFHSF